MADTTSSTPTTAPATSGAPAPGDTGATTLTTAAQGASGAPAPATPSTPPGAAPADTSASPPSAPDKAGAAPAEAEKPADKPPEAKPAEAASLELKLPQGVQAGPAFEEFKGLAKAAGLSGEQAQRVVDFYAKTELARADAAQKQQTAWVEGLKADKELGGASFEVNAQVARKAMQKFASPELRTFLDTSGLGNHPELVRLMYRVGKAIGEDSIASGNGATPAGSLSDPEARLRARYPTMPQFQKES
jgi:hypothetical protein